MGSSQIVLSPARELLKEISGYFGVTLMFFLFIAPTPVFIKIIKVFAFFVSAVWRHGSLSCVPVRVRAAEGHAVARVRQSRWRGDGAVREQHLRDRDADRVLRAVLCLHAEEEENRCHLRRFVPRCVYQAVL